MKQGSFPLIFLPLVLLFIFTYPVLAMETAYSSCQPNFYMVYEIVEGDNLISIAEKFAVTVDGIRWANGLIGTDLIKAGDELIIPPRIYNDIPALNGQVDPTRSPELRLELGLYPVYFYYDLPEVDLPPDKVILYQVRHGDTLYDLAREFNTQVTYLQALNKLPVAQIRQGQRIYLPINNLTPRQALRKTISPEELDLLARTIHAEARGEPYIGQVAVGAVILNRVLSNRYPNTIHGVVYQPVQFSCVSDGQLRLQANETAFRAAREALDGVDPTRGALYYYNPNIATATWWLETREVTVIIGNHLFAH